MLSTWLLSIILLTGCSDSPSVPMPEPPEPGEVLADGLTTDPEKAVAGEQLTITFKAATTSPLYGHTGDVYAHIGVVEGPDWLYAPAWSENLSKYKMEKPDDNTWRLVLSPDIRAWFGAAETVPVSKIGVVVRSADGTIQSEDMFISVEDTSFTPGEISYEARPAGVIDGINIISQTTVTLAFYDLDKNGGHKEYAYVIGDFNDWTVESAHQMKRDNDAGCWWITLEGLNPSKEYGFQYYTGTQADGPMRLADAYTEKILDPSNDPYIPASTYPEAKDYPEGKTTGIVSTFRTVPQTYNWRVADYKTDNDENLVIYELLLRDFTESGDLNGAMEKLDYLRSMGVNAVELMPVQEFDANDSWGYNPCFYFAMDKAYGTKNMYKNFIDACHERGMAVILDVVYNHATGANPFARLYWNTADNKTAANNPWFNIDAPHPYSVFHDFNHESPLVRAFVKRNLAFLLEEYRIDGFRFDLTKGFTQNSSNDDTAANYDASRITILKDYNAAIKAISPDAVVILEHFAEEAEEKVLAEDGMKLWRNLNYAYQQAGMGWTEGSSFTALTTDGTTMPFGSWVGYMESHDEERVGYKQTMWGDGNLKTDLETRMKQLEVNAALFFTVPGPKLMWQFGEMGYDVSIDHNGRTGRKPIRWEYLNEPERKALHDTYTQLITLRQDYPQFFGSDATLLEWNVATNDWGNGRDISLTAIDGKRLYVVGNLTDAAITRALPSGTWYDYFNGGGAVTESSVAIPAHSYMLYSNFR